MLAKKYLTQNFFEVTADIEIETNSITFQNLLCIDFVNKRYMISKDIQIFHKSNLKLYISWIIFMFRH